MKARRTARTARLVLVAAAAVCSCAAMINGMGASRSVSARLLQSDDDGNATAAALPELVAPPGGVLAIAATASIGLGLTSLVCSYRLQAGKGQ